MSDVWRIEVKTQVLDLQITLQLILHDLDSILMPKLLVYQAPMVELADYPSAIVIVLVRNIVRKKEKTKHFIWVNDFIRIFVNYKIFLKSVVMPREVIVIGKAHSKAYHASIKAFKKVNEASTA